MSKRLSLSLSLARSLTFSFSLPDVHFAKLSVLFDNISHVDPLNEMKYFYDVVRELFPFIILFFF